MTTQPGMTIAIPNWNHECFLPRSVGSALSALASLRTVGEDGEVLVIDDASRDGSISLLRRLEATHCSQGLRIFARKQNAGLTANRNLALAIARFDSVLLLDADNELVPENAPLLLEALRSTGAAGVYGNLLHKNSGEEFAVGLHSHEPVHSGIFDLNFVDALALVDRCQVLDAGGYEAASHPWEDWDLWLHLIALGRKLVHVPVIAGYYHSLPASMIKEGQSDKQPKMDRIRRVYDQLGRRGAMRHNTDYCRYHPALGFL